MKRKKAPAPDLDNIIPVLIGVWRRFNKETGPGDLLQTREFRRTVEAIKVLQQGFDGEMSLIGQDYFSKPELLGAYLLYHWMIHYQEGLSLIGELPNSPKRVLDVCSGPAPFAFAALRHGAHEVIAADRNETALHLGAEVCGRYGMPLAVRKWDCLKQPLPVEGKFDLIILGHALSELFPENQKSSAEHQYNFIRSLLQKLTPNGYLLLVDSSFKEANKRLLLLRDRLVKENIPVQAPCVWRGECPALQTPNSPCYAQRELEKPYLLKELQRGAEINLSSLKMSYIIFRNPEAGWPKLPERDLYRVISPPIESFQGKRYYLCGTDGKKNLGSHLNPPPKEARAFEFLRRGELISLEKPLDKHHSLDIVQGTQLNIEAACGKPLPEFELPS
jgi:SAM-dependent methyltransferase